MIDFSTAQVISNKAYREAPGISSTELKKIAKSPAHYLYYKENPEKTDTKDLMLGRAAHKYALEIGDFFNEYAIGLKCDRRTTKGKEDYARFLEENEGKEIIPLDTFEQVTNMRKALYETPFVEKLLKGRKELSFFTKDDITGLSIKCRPDCITTVGDTNILIDYKTTENAETDAFTRQAIKLNYDLQIAYYYDIVSKVTNSDFKVVFIAQEKKPPYLVNVMQCDENFLRSGRDMYRTMLDTYADCKKTGNWYGYINDKINSLGLPSWLAKMYEGQEDSENE